MKAITVFYDARCGLCGTMKSWLEKEPKFVALHFVPYDSRHADLLFEIVSRRYLQRPILLTTNKPFAAWGEVFPNATSVVTLVDRLVHRCEVVPIEGDSYRRKESREEARRRAQDRAARRKT